MFGWQMALGICKIIIAFWHSTGLRPVLPSVGPLGHLFDEHVVETNF